MIERHVCCSPVDAKTLLTARVRSKEEKTYVRGYQVKLAFLIWINSMSFTSVCERENVFLSLMSCVKCKRCLHKRGIKHAQKSYSCDSRAYSNEHISLCTRCQIFLGAAVSSTCLQAARDRDLNVKVSFVLVWPGQQSLLLGLVDT